MRGYGKTLIYGILTLIISLGFMTGCGEKYNESKETSTEKLSQQVIDNIGVINKDELKKIESSEDISLTDDSPSGAYWVPKNQKTILSKVVPWLKEAKAYKGKVSKDQFISGGINAFFKPSELHIRISDNHAVAIQPAFHLLYVLKLDIDGQESYIESKELYDWLRNDKWKTEFERK